MDVNFADRFFWARHRMNLGAPTIAAETGCGQALVFSIERGEGAKSSKFNDKFAKLFGVDKDWLRTGHGKIPDGFDGPAAKRAREQGSRRSGKIIDFRDIAGDTPRWASPKVDGADPVERAAELQKSLFENFQEYTQLVGADRTTAFLDVLSRLAALMGATKKP
jgi:hypothetical protein